MTLPTRRCAFEVSTVLVTKLDLLRFVPEAFQPHSPLFAFYANGALSKESFNSRLKAEGDESSTNLYISNLPKSITETVSSVHSKAEKSSANMTQELGVIFMDYTILSSKILRDSMGNSRGVGFARYVCCGVRPTLLL